MKQAQGYFLIRPKQVQAAIKHDMFFGSWREINEGHGKWPIVLTRVVIDGLRQNRVRVSRPRRHTPTKMFHRCPTPGGGGWGGGGCMCSGDASVLKVKSRPFQILLGNFLATFRILSNFFVREQLLATFRKTSTFLVTFGLFWTKMLNNRPFF